MYQLSTASQVSHRRYSSRRGHQPSQLSLQLNSNKTIRSIALTELDKTLPKHVSSSPKHQLRHRRLRLHYLSIASLCLVLSVTATVFECFALFNIQFCDGEDLMQIYWGFWSVLQVGSNIAILGVMVQFWIVLGDIETPSMSSLPLFFLRFFMSSPSILLR